MHTTIQAELDKLFSDPTRNISAFKPPPHIQLAIDLGVKPQEFRRWFNRFRALTGCNPWFRLHEGTFIAFLDYLRTEGLIDE